MRCGRYLNKDNPEADQKQRESREDRVNHFICGLNPIRDSRIACGDGLRDTPSSCWASEVSQPMRFPRDCERSARGMISQSEAALKLQISKRTQQEWEQARAAPRGFARTAIENAIHAWRLPAAASRSDAGGRPKRAGLVMEIIAMRESRIPTPWPSDANGCSGAMINSTNSTSRSIEDQAIQFWRRVTQSEMGTARRLYRAKINTTRGNGENVTVKPYAQTGTRLVDCNIWRKNGHSRKGHADAIRSKR